MIPFMGRNSLQRRASSRKRRTDVVAAQHHDLFECVAFPKIVITLDLGECRKRDTQQKEKQYGFR